MRSLLRTSLALPLLSLVACGSTTSAASDAGVTDSSSDGLASDTVATDTKTGGDTSRVPLDHRPNDSACAGVPAAGNCSLAGGTGSCTKDGDCATGTNGRCVENSGGGARMCFCSYDTCAHDTDCPAGKLCACHGSSYLTGGNTCLDGNCRVDGDCGAGGYCSPSRGGGCGGLSGYYCHTSGDTCVDDTDCKSDGGGPQMCAFMPSTTKRWECTPQMLCP
jgi:hypothetical protein